MKKYTIKEYYNMTDGDFKLIYEDPDFKDILDFLETRIRLEILAIIRRFRLKGEVIFEVRKKSTSSAYSKLQSELVSNQTELGTGSYYLHEILKDLIGARIVCIHEQVQKRVFDYILQVESVVIQPHGLEFYSAPFREYTLSKDIHEELVESIRGVNSSWGKQEEIEKKHKSSNYESLHFYVKFASKVDIHLLKRLTDSRSSRSEGERVRDQAEGKYLLGLHEKFNATQLQKISEMPIEFQVRTITDHLWAQEEHKYVYKNTPLPGTTQEDRQAIDVLRGTFVGLKFAYYSVDRLRYIVRNVSASNLKPTPPTYAGTSADINSFRLVYFENHASKIENKIRKTEEYYISVDKNLIDGTIDGRRMLDIVVDLYRSVLEIDNSLNDQPSMPFDIESWGRKRFFYLTLAYMALSSSSKSLTDAAAEQLKSEIDLIDMVGEAAFRASVQDNDHGLVKLASKIYERVDTFDRISRTFDNLSDEKRGAFVDPLVGIRLASSFFIQGEFAGALKAMRDMFEIAGDDDMISWSKLETAKDFTPAEILMRYSQYIFFESFEDEDRLVDNFVVLQDVFSTVFDIKHNRFNPKLYRCFAWYYSMITYLFTQKTLVPNGLTQFREDARSYLEKYYKTASESLISGKPETLLVNIYLPIHLLEKQHHFDEIDKAHKKFTDSLRHSNSYPRDAVSHLNRMAAKIGKRALDKSRQQSNTTFISYSREDSELIKDLESILRKNNVNVHSDRDFEKGSGITEQVETAMLGANSAVLVVTPNYFKSQWTAEERAFLLDKRRRKELQLFVLRVGIESDEIAMEAPLLSEILSYTANVNDLEAVATDMAFAIKKPSDF